MAKNNSTLLILFLFFTYQALAQDVSYTKKDSKDSLHINLINNTYTPIKITLEARDSLKKFIRVEPYSILPPKDSLINVIAIPKLKIPDSSDFKFGSYIKFYSVYGDPKTIKPDLDYLYTLPFSKGKKYKVTQSFNGKKSHNSIKSKYAIDFNLKIGDTVCAARGGIVVKTISHFKKSGGKDYIRKANKIVLMHSDGTYSNYVHLDFNGVMVNEGDIVKAGEAIGISGNTGYSGGPHLHFVVRKEDDIAIPVYFKGYKRKILKQDKKYKRTN
ncbi:M23 family metallopeptidase [Winogradskyella luteola]|uniref:M23 family metallopeptidase n=1 Tax=Winogradskyella luteola TaxID=2828330 RepID=A0A9X1JP95_9FLAO|nr:M23 family metallopeptidase [Winogradskyella luteola]MBV7268494.1 M23 family metallopeptidase [Winogradskyella luteola]